MNRPDEQTKPDRIGLCLEGCCTAGSAREGGHEKSALGVLPGGLRGPSHVSAFVGRTLIRSLKQIPTVVLVSITEFLASDTSW